MKNIEYYPKRSNNTLMSWTKKTLVREIEILLHNWDVECERAENISNYAMQLQEKLDMETSEHIKHMDRTMKINIWLLDKYGEQFKKDFNIRENDLTQDNLVKISKAFEEIYKEQQEKMPELWISYGIVGE